MPPGNRVKISNGSIVSSMEDILAKVMQRVEYTNVGVKELKTL